ncbi:MAG TPA: tetratricopeptide repeat protein [Thermoanaerobaculaceae bacterium]|jgi:Tetratricopeptide repeat|nr:tetratricopeptide repeat protein [Thermoanaerobaculaceae bacterium]
MWKNPIATAVIGLLLGFFFGYLIGQKQGVVPVAQATDPHAGVPGAPALTGQPQMPPEGGRTAATANPRLLEQTRELETLIAKDPKNYDHLVQMANTQYDLNDFVKAVDYYEKARAIKDDSPDVLTDLGVCYKETGKPQKALELFDRAADMRPDHWQSRYNAAVVRLFDLNDPAGAKVEVDKLKQLQGKIPGIPDLTGLEGEIAKRTK